MGSFSVQKPIIPRIPQSGVAEITSDNGKGGITARLYGDKVVFEIEATFIGQERREPLKFHVDKSQAVSFCKAVVDIVKAQDEVNKWLHEQVKAAVHGLAANDRVKTMFSDDESQ